MDPTRTVQSIAGMSGEIVVSDSSAEHNVSDPFNCDEGQIRMQRVRVVDATVVAATVIFDGLLPSHPEETHLDVRTVAPS